MTLANRVDGIAPFHVMAILARARELEAQGRNIIHLEIGEPDFPTPEPILNAALAAIKGGNVHYTPALGLPELREAIAGFYRDRHGLTVDSSRIAVTPGASGALLLAAGALLDPGDEILLADPGYPCNRHFARFVNARPVSIAVGPDSGFQLTASLVEQHWTENTKVVLLASPSNPTGTLAQATEVRAITALCADRQASLIVDEIYHGLVYEENPQTALTYSSKVWVVNSFSKYFHMTGWRLGWLVAPENAMEAIERLAQNLFLAAPTPAQHGALAAFQPSTMEILEARRLELKERRDFMVSALNELGFALPAVPHGAFYLYADVSVFTNDSFVFAQKLLEDVGVAVTPGLDFGAFSAERFVRFAYTRPLPALKEAVERIRAFVRRQ
ncbi:MAG: pyridoxal phosphate-dependent aminotransferase [Thiobacillaceae bacterium]